MSFSIQLSNNWLSVFPSYTKSLFLRDFIVLNDKLKHLEPKKEELHYYSWVRLLVDVGKCEILIKKQKQYHIECSVEDIKLNLKCTSSPTLSIPNPILILQYQDTIYTRNRKYSDAIQVD